MSRDDKYADNIPYDGDWSSGFNTLHRREKKIKCIKKQRTYYKIHHKKHSRISLFTLENGNKDEKKKEIFMLEEEYHFIF